MKAQILNVAEKSARLLKITKSGKQLSTPSFFPAVSGLGFGFQTKEILQLLLGSGYPRVMVSCYDISTYRSERGKMIGELSEYFRKGSFVMLDSGIFESYWKGDRTWTFDKYRHSVSKIDSDFYLGFDVLPSPQLSHKQFVRKTINQALKERALSGTSEFIPIVHGKTADQLVSVVGSLTVAQPQLTVIAVPERDCGRSFVERAETILRIRRILDETNKTLVLHILGCGNPISLALFAYCGADTFDSLIWTKMTVDPVNLQLVDLTHLELLSCRCKACLATISDPISRALLHNLLFYQDFSVKIHSMIRRETLWDFLVEFVGLDVLNKFKNR